MGLRTLRCSGRANGVLLGFLLILPQRRWAGLLAAGFAASLLVHIGYAFDLRESLVTSAANVIEVLAAAWPFALAGDLKPDLTPAAHAVALCRD